LGRRKICEPYLAKLNAVQKDCKCAQGSVSPS
jgi:hypothetical protein